MKSQYIIGIDIGTTGTKCIAFDPSGKEISSAYATYPMHQPHDGWAEEDPGDWWEAVCACLQSTTRDIPKESIAGVGLSGQMHSLVLLDEHDRVLRPAILWCDTRTGEECAAMERAIGRERLIEITGNPAMPAFTASKLLWVRDHEPQLYKQVKHILLAKDYIRFVLTGERATDASDASGMQLLDVRKRAWSEELCQDLQIDPAILPTVYEGPQVTGYVTKTASALTGLPCGVPVAAGGGDNAASAIGAACVSAGHSFTTVGTSGVVLSPTDTPIIDKQGRIHTFCAAVPSSWHLLGTTQAAGLSLQWFRKQFAERLSYAEIDRLSEVIPAGSERLIYLPFLMGSRTPVLDTDARGVFFGLSPLHTTGHMCRAVMEGVTYSLYSCVRAMQDIGAVTQDMAFGGGGANSPLWQGLLADVYGVDVKTLRQKETACLGAAILGGCAGGVYRSIEDGCEKAVCVDHVRPTDAEAHSRYEGYYRLYNELYFALRSSFADLQLLR